ncbi:MAG: hypothetical protein K9M56_05570, partial [Victivallales bacterium]|nr:hypothetical protein [Victivallales bacterium]
HGEFPKAVFAPGTLEECYSLTRKALETAHKYQSPVVLLTDQYLQDHIENTEAFDMGYNPIARHIEENPENDYHRYAVTKNGISPRAVPGKKTTVVSDSHEHNLNGHITEDLNIRLCLQNKRMRKLSGMIEESIPPALYGVEDAEELFICWGSTYGPCREAVDTLNQNGTKSDMLHFSQVWPLNREKIDSMIKYYNRVYVVEGNSTGQLGLLLKETGVISAYDLIARYDGLPITAEYIVSKKNN